MSKKGVKWRIDILQEGYGANLPKTLELPFNEPLVIEWPEQDKLEPIRRSSATLKIICDNDREYTDLYTVEVGAIRMDIHRNGSLYWSGTLDTELYQEPYAYKRGYEVTLTFADLACLDRLDWSETGLMSIHDVISCCLDMSGINYKTVEKHISTQRYTNLGYRNITLEEINVLQDNFYDEEGIPMTASEVLEGVLKPFALCIIQKAGRIHLYDLNALHALEPVTIEWDSTDGMLDVDKVYNNVQVVFSPYADAKMMEGDVNNNDKLTDETGGILFRTSYVKDSYGNSDALEGFRLHHNTEWDSNLTLSSGARYFQICPIHSGSEDTGVIMSLRTREHSCAGDDRNTVTPQIFNHPKDCGTIAKGNINTETIITCPKVYLGYTSINRMNYRLKISLDLLWDVRYNPFEAEDENNESGLFGKMNDWCNFAYVPIRLTLRSIDGTALYHYENYKIMESATYKTRTCGWVAGEGSWGQAYLAYYDWENRKNKTGLGGWAKNKQIIGYYRDALPKKWQDIGDGEFIELPMTGGYLELEIGAGLHQFDYKREVKDIYKFTRWVAYKNPTITLCRKNYKEVTTEDIEDSAWLNRAAKEDMPIETVVGTMTKKYGVPNAKGQLFDSEYNIYSEFSRAGITDRLERLLIGTVYSQYASRHDMLSGTVKLLPEFGIYADRSTSGKFVLVSEIQDCMEDTSEMAMVHFVEDNYQGVEYE